MYEVYQISDNEFNKDYQFTTKHGVNYFLKLSKKSITTIKMSFVLSILYNIVGLSFAITGNLLPLVAAIIMPLSTVTIVSFVTIASNFYAKRLI
jgi:Cu+-exporting ATPase